jgi:hypothetical protein
MFNFFKKPTLKTTLVADGTKAKVKIRNANQSQVIILLYYAIKQTALHMRIDHRHLMNKLIDIDKTVVKSQKQEVKKSRYGKGK